MIIIWYALEQGTSTLRVQHADTLSDYLQSHSQLTTQLTETERRELNRGWGIKAIQPDSMSAFSQVSETTFETCDNNYCCLFYNLFSN